MHGHVKFTCYRKINASMCKVLIKVLTCLSCGLNFAPTPLPTLKSSRILIIFLGFIWLESYTIWRVALVSLSSSLIIQTFA